MRKVIDKVAEWIAKIGVVLALIGLFGLTIGVIFYDAPMSMFRLWVKFLLGGGMMFLIGAIIYLFYGDLR